MSARPVVVALATPRLQSFERLDDIGVQVIPVADGIPDPDIIVFPAGTTKVFLESVAAAKALAAPLRERIAAGAVRIVVDASSEGAEHSPRRTALVHEIVRSAGAPLSRGVYVTQEINYAAEYRAYCAAEGLGELMTVLHHDAWIWRFLDQFRDTGERVLAERLEAFRRRPPLRERRLVSLNYTPREHKVLFLLRLLRDGLWDQAFVSFGGVERYKEVFGAKDDAGVIRHLAALPGFDDLAHDLAPQLPALAAFGRQMLDPPSAERFDAHRDVDLPHYAQSWFAVVTETEMHPRPSRITEKPMKALVNFEPFAVLGNPHALKALRALGFRTFPEMFDERYDEVFDPRERFDLVYNQVLRLARMDQAELGRLEHAMADTLLHNARWGLIEMPTVARRHAFRSLVATILAA